MRNVANLIVESIGENKRTEHPDWLSIRLQNDYPA